MKWQEKALALETLCELSLKMRNIDDWYVSQNIEVKDGGILKGIYGNGVTPEEAINDHWNKLVFELADNEYLVTKAYGDRKAVVWDGFMWKDIIE
jgi:hypothetical protein